MKRFGVIVSVPFLLAFTTPTVVKWSAAPVTIAQRGTRQASIKVRGRIIDRWHVYSLTQKGAGPKPLTFTLEQADGFTLGTAKGPVPQRAYDKEFQMTTETYTGTPEFIVPITWSRPLPRGTSKLRLVVRYMACSDKLCLPPRNETVTVELRSAGTK